MSKFNVFPADPTIYSFGVNLENPFQIIYDESSEPQSSSKKYSGSNLCGIVDFDGRTLPWGRRNLEKNPDILCIGCSCTVAMGLIEEYSWPSLIRATTGLTVNNLSSPGAGVEMLCAMAINSFATYGMPRQIFALFPDLYRLWTLNPDSAGGEGLAHTIHGSWHTEVCEYFLDVRHSSTSPNDRPDNAKPLMFKNGNKEKTTFSVDRAIFNSFTMLDMLLYFCQLNNLEFAFTSWENEANKVFSRLRHYGQSFKTALISANASLDRHEKMLIESITPMNEAWWRDEKDISDVYRTPWRRLGIGLTCEHEPQTDYQRKFWSVASDSGAHPGIHDQIHFAEHLCGSRISNEFLRTLP